MKNKFKIILAVFLAASLLTFTFTGCARPDKDQQDQTELFPERDVPGVPGENMGTSPSPSPSLGTRNGNKNGNLLNDNLPNNETPQANNGRNETGLDGQTPMQQGSFDKERADKIINQLEKIDGIDEVSAVLNGKTDVVVYNPTDPDNTSNEIDTMIAGKVKDVDKSITKVEISHSSSAMTKIKELTDNIRQNKPMEELNDMFQQLMRTINPQS